MRLWQTLKSGWMVFALWLGKIQTAILLSLVYFLAIGPTAIVSRLGRRDLLGLREPKDESYAVPLDHITETLEGAHKQF
ncbi:MAG: hypothetical protein A2Y95_02005 [Deltaproteobacteria bacterium RBG_13_65_10]|nr:MAG: hypothetical protein A2Y95_02005 [Deltaproteobacteria bacterium RBG_13_65_10]